MLVVDTRDVITCLW